MPIAQTIESYFKQLDWPYQRQDEHNWLTGFKGQQYAFPVYVRTDDFWLYVYVAFPAQVNPAARAKLYEHLLRLNYEVNMAKFMLDQDDQLGLTVELPHEHLQLVEFETALQSVCFHMDCNYVELVNLATLREPEAKG